MIFVLEICTKNGPISGGFFPWAQFPPLDTMAVFHDAVVQDLVTKTETISHDHTPARAGSAVWFSASGRLRPEA
jgi:hypothetical protein